MTLESGQTLGPYEITDRLGAGGMGEVYLGRDTRLDRTVAVKVLPVHLSGSAELRERFEREARTISSLNHPHICALYDVGSQDGIDYLVMEHLDGETLAERLKRGPLPLAQVLSRAIEIADALDKAHRNGVVHRDLKPGNVMLINDGGAKLLDFGLAKQGPGTDASPVSSLPTEAKSLTEKGAILGTFQYMAPEQLEGEAVDARTDIFALGALIYEMITGKKAFAGKSQASLITAIMSREPEPASSLDVTTPPFLDHVVQRCLAKDPKERWQSAYDVVRELKWIQEGGSDARGAATAQASEDRAASSTRMAGAFLVGAILATVATLLLTRPEPPAPRSLQRFTVTMPDDVSLRGNVDISANGRTIISTVFHGATRVIYQRAIDQLAAIPIAGTENATGLTISPDGEWVAFTVGGLVKKVSLRGGPPLTLGEGGTSGVDWSDPDFIVYSENGIIWQVSAAGGESHAITERGDDEAGHFDPALLPGGQTVLFRTSVDGESVIAAQSLSTGERRVLVDGTSPRYASSGHLLFDRAGSIWAAPFDPEGLELRGEPVPFIENVEVNTNGYARYEVSRDGTLVYVPRRTSQSNRLVWVDREGQVQPLDDERRMYLHPRVSPDGRRIAATIGEGESDIWIYETSRGTRVRLTTGDGRNIFPAWAPDGERVFFGANRSDASGLYARAADGSGDEELLSPKGSYWPYFVVPDSFELAIGLANAGASFDVAMLTVDGELSPLLSTPFAEGNAALSPDGRWMAYQTTESGAFEIHMQSFPDLGGKRVVSTDGGTEPVWAADGSELFYRNGDQMMFVPVELGDELRLGEPEVLFEGSFEFSSGGGRNYDVSPGGERFAMIQADAISAPRTIHVILNFFDELERVFSLE